MLKSELIELIKDCHEILFGNQEYVDGITLLLTGTQLSINNQYTAWKKNGRIGYRILAIAAQSTLVLDMKSWFYATEDEKDDEFDKLYCQMMRPIAHEALESLKFVMKDYTSYFKRKKKVYNLHDDYGIMWPVKFLKTDAIAILDRIHDLLFNYQFLDNDLFRIDKIIEIIVIWRHYCKEKEKKAYNFDGYGDLVRGRNKYTRGIKSREQQHKQWTKHTFRR